MFCSILSRNCIGLGDTIICWYLFYDNRVVNLMEKTNKFQQKNNLTGETIEQFFDFVMANALRVRLFPSVVTFRVPHMDKTDETLRVRLNEFFNEQLRDSDLLASVADNEWVFVLTNSGENEARAFVQRIFSNDLKEKLLIDSIHFSVCITIINQNVTFNEVISDARKQLDLMLNTDQVNVTMSRTYATGEKEEVKISLIESHSTLLEVLERRLLSMENELFDVQLRTFEDGFEFLQSDWYKTSHQHLIILNEIMPRMNGYDVLYTLNKEPNFNKFRILMLAERAIDEDIVNAYENGLDDYIQKPFKIDVFEAKVKRLIGR